MVNIDVVFSSLIAQAPLVAVAILVLYYTLDKRIDKAKAELGGRIDRLVNTVAGLSNRVERLKNSVVTLNNRVEKLEGAVVELKSRVEKLEGSMADLQKGVDDLKSCVERLEGSVAELRNRIERLEGSVADLMGRVDSIGARLNAIRRDVRSLGRGFYMYQTALIDFMASKGVVSEPEAVLLKGTLKAVVPYSQSRYYTEEVRRRLIALLDKEIKDYTWDDVAELEKIAEAIYN